MTLKQTIGGGAALLLPQCRFDATIFLLGHMRCGSTALSSVICAHPLVSGYGEAHVRYDGRGALGVLALNQLRRGAFRPTAPRLFDKVLHNRYDQAACPGFHAARAVFLVRPPVETIRSIRNLFASLGSLEYGSDQAAADYLEQRVEGLAALWDRFAPDRRIALTYAQLTEAPAACLASISQRLALTPALTNGYRADPGPKGHGAGDPLSAHRFDRIVPSARSTSIADQTAGLQLSPARLQAIDELYAEVVRHMGAGAASDAPLPSAL